MEENWLETLREALDHVEYGVILLDKTLTARFVNKAFRDMWRFPDPTPENPLTFPQMMEYGRERGNWDVAPEAAHAYIADRIERVRRGADGPRMLRLHDKRIIKFQCIPLPAGGRMLTYADQSQLVNAVEQLERIANIDELTQIYNRRYLYACGGEETGRARRYSRPLSVIMFDIDHFKQINDKHGHAGGDKVLREISQSCAAMIHSNDILGRIGGEEFALLLPETALPEAMIVASKLRAVVNKTAVNLDSGPLHITASFGVSTWTFKLNTFDELLGRADTALYAAKQAGRDQVVADSAN